MSNSATIKHLIYFVFIIISFNNNINDKNKENYKKYLLLSIFLQPPRHGDQGQRSAAKRILEIVVGHFVVAIKHDSKRNT